MPDVDYSAYHRRLKALIERELKRLNLKQSQLAQRLNVSPQAVSSWVHMRVQGPVSLEAIDAIAKHLGRSTGALRTYLESGEWSQDEHSIAEVVADLTTRVEKLEKRISTPSPRTGIVSEGVSGRRRVGQELLAMLPLAMALQDAVAASGGDWRDRHVILSVYAAAADEAKLAGVTPVRFQMILWGYSPPINGEVEAIAKIMRLHTKEPRGTAEFVWRLVDQDGGGGVYSEP
jgi:transcriptional regulator with XRE-family HTH domain